MGRTRRSSSRLPKPSATKTLPVFNNGQPLTVVWIPSEWEGDDGEVGIVDASKGSNWVWRASHPWTSTRVPELHTLTTVDLPHIPESYGRWLPTSIGGLSKTVRRVGMVRCKTKTACPVVVFAIHADSETTVSDVFAPAQHDHLCTLGDTQYDDELGYMTEIVVYDAQDVAHVAARIARAGAVPVLEDPTVDAKRGLGIERLDRIHADVVCDPTCMHGENDGTYGLRRGSENWSFPWLPKDWKPPITWDHMVQNVLHRDFATLPKLVQQHVARVRMDMGDVPPLGTVWEETFPPSQEERETSSGRCIATVSPDVVDALTRGQTTMETPAVRSDGTPVDTDTLVEARDGRWYRPVDTSRVLKAHVPAGPNRKRWVSAALTKQQSEQLIEAFYFVCIDMIQDPVLHKAFEMILFVVMQEQGYTARWMGKYDQFALHVGNGNTYRKFRRLAQYDPHRLPSDVLNKLCDRDGTLRNRGSKGSRSKYKTDAPRYVPKRRLKRTREDEERMVESA